MKQARGDATTKSKGGGGAAFEFSVIAWCLANMLAGRNPFSGDGRIVQVEAQAAEVIDDVLVTLQGEQTIPAHLFVRKQVLLSSSGLNQDFVTRAHELLAEGEGQVMLVGCIGSEANAAPREKLHEISTNADHQSLKAFKTKFRGADARQIVGSLADPKAGSDAKDESAWTLARQLYYKDFGGTQLEAEAKLLCELALENPKDWRNLWNALVAFAAEFDPNGGVISDDTLVSKLRGSFRLVVSPRYHPSWVALSGWTTQKSLRVRDSVGPDIRITRTEVLGELRSATSRSRATLLIGPMGSGKSVISRQLLEQRSGDDAVVRFSLTDALPDPAEFASLKGVDYPALRLMRATTTASPLMIFDQVDAACFDRRTRQSLIAWLDLLGHSELSHWRVLLICSSELEERFRTLTQVQVDEVVSTSGFDDQELLLVSQSLNRNQFSEAFASVLTRPLFLDIALSINAQKDLSDLTEPILALQFWQKHIRGNHDGVEGAKDLAKFATALGDRGLLSLPEGEAEAPTKHYLYEDRILESRDDGRVAFTQDIYGRWARFVTLNSLEKGWHQFLIEGQRTEMLLWKDAIELFAQHLFASGKGSEAIQILLNEAPTLPTPDKESKLEKAFKKAAAKTPRGEEGLAVWEMRRLEEQRSASPVNMALLVGFINTRGLAELVRSHWKDLTSNSGWLLRLFLRNVLIAGTMPNPLYKDLKHDPQIGSVALIVNRVPRREVFASVLAASFEQIEDVSIFAHRELVALIEAWILRGTGDLDNQAAIEEFVLDQAEKELARTYRDRQTKQPAEEVFRCALHLFPSYSDRVKNLALRAMRRISSEPITESESRLKQPKRTRQAASIPSEHFWARREWTKPWPDGPLSEPDEEFAHVWFGGDGATGICRLDPDLAIELTLAGLIEAPRQQEASSWASNILDDGGFDSRHPWITPGWWRNPLPPLLVHHPQKCVDLCLKIIDFGTDRWTESHPRTSGYSIFLDGAWKEFRGNHLVLRWDRDTQGVPRPPTTACFWLEWFLAELAKEAVNAATKVAISLLRKSDSAATLGVVTHLARRHPHLLHDDLGFLFSCPELVREEQSMNLLPISVSGAFDSLPQERLALAEWMNQPHMKISILQFLPYVLFGENKGKSWLEEAKRRLDARDTTKNDLWLDRYASFLDQRNYTVENQDDNTRAISYQEPAELTAKYAHVGLAISRQQNAIHVWGQVWMWAAEGRQPQLNADQFWAAIVELSKGKPEGIVSRRFLEAGVASILAGLWPDWVKVTGERFDWCVKQLSTTVAAELLRKPDGMPIKNRLDWRLPVGRGLPSLFRLEPSNVSLRSAVASAMWDCAPELPFLIISGLAHEKPDDRKVAIEAASIAILSAVHDGPLWRRVSEKKQGLYGFEEATRESEQLRSNTVEEFSKGKSSFQRIGPRDEIERLANGDWRTLNPDDVSHRLMPADIERWGNTLAAMDWIMEEGNAGERTWLDGQWRDWLMILNEFLVVNANDDDEPSRGYDGWEHLYGHLARYAIKRFSPNEAVEFLGPIFDLGSHCSGNVLQLVSEWRKCIFYSGSNNDLSVYWLVTLCRAKNLETWSWQQRMYRIPLDLWGELLGISKHNFELLPLQAEEAVGASADFYKEATPLWTNSDGWLYGFVGLLRSEAGSSIFLPALEWIAQQAHNNGLKQLDHPEPALTELLEWVWTFEAERLRASEYRSAYLSLLSWLVGRKDIRAIELQKQVTGLL